MADSNETLLETPLASLHRELGARMVPFAGYAMPVQYPAGIMAEHLATRAGAALFDVSHMGQARLTGVSPLSAIEEIVPGDFIGLQDEFAEGQTHGVEAATDATLCVFERDRLWELFHAQPRIGYDITWLAAREEKMLDDNLVTNGRRNAPERIAMLLMHLYRRAERLGMTRDGGVPFPFNQQHIADALGLSLVHTNKTLRRLQGLGLHRIEDGLLRLLEPHALQTLGDYFERPLRRVPLI